MSKNTQNILSNCFKKTTKSAKDYIPPTVKQENIREEFPLKFPESFDKDYSPKLIPNVLFPEWPSDEIINSFDFSNGGKKYLDPNSNLLIFPYSLRKETYTNFEWLRPENYLEKKKLISLIKEKMDYKNFNFIKNKIELATKNLLNFENDFKEKEENKEENEENENNNINNNNINSNKEINEEKENEKEKNILSILDNMEININRRNSIDIAIAEGHNSSFVKEFYNSKLNNEEKQIFLEYQKYLKEKDKEKIIIVNSEEVDPPIQNLDQKNQKNKNEIQIIFHKLLPSNMDLSLPLCDYCRWIASQYQIILDNKINTENDKNNFLRCIYPQDKNGVPQYNPSGLYWVKLYHMGKYRKIEIDDRFPVNKETYDNYFPLTENKSEIWPLILTKALIKLYSYKYKCDKYEQEEIGDTSILYSLTKYIGVKLSNNTFFDYLNNLQNKKKSEKEEDNQEIDNLILDKENTEYNGYDVIVAYINSRTYGNNNNIQEKNKEKKDEIIPYINKNRISYKERIIKIEEINKRSPKYKKSTIQIKKLSLRNKIPTEILLQLEKFEKNIVSSTQKELVGNKRYKEIHRFLTNENIYKNYEKFIVEKGLKLHDSGLICDVGYTLLEIFQCGNFNMRRLKPIDFSDMKLDIKVKYKQMSPDEKANYLEKIKDLKIRQKKEKINRINKYLENGTNILFIKFTNESNLKNKKKAYLIETLFNMREIEAAKNCIKNKYSFPPENYFENTFIPKLTKDEETGEINFWTKNFYRRLLKDYFKEEEKKLSNENNEENNNDNNINNENNNINKNLFQEFEEKSSEFNNELNLSLNDLRNGTWMRYEIFKTCFNNFILFKNGTKFKYNLNLDNIWYNYEKDIFEENEHSKIVFLQKEENSENIINNNNFNNILKENELYIIFEPNSEKNNKSVSGEMPYQKNEETKLGHKFNDLNCYVSISIYEVNESKTVTKIKSFTLKDYFTVYNIDLSNIQQSKNSKNFFINIQSGLFPFGFNLEFFSNFYKIENYSYNQFLIEYKNYQEKKINIMHPILPKGKFYLIKTFKIEFKNEENNNNKIVNFFTNFINYDDNVVKNNIDVVLINPITNKKVKIYYRKFFNIDFNISSFYRVELSVISPYNVNEKNFEYIVLYNSPYINIEVFENIYPFYIRQKYFPNKHNILFNELIFPSDLINTTLDISLEYRPNENNNDENKNNNNENNNYSDEALINLKEKSFPFSIRVYFYFSLGDKLVFKKDFENSTLIRNLILESKNINPKDIKDVSASNNLILGAYSIKCVLDKEQTPSWMLNPNEYKNDVYWKISVFATDALTFVKNTIKEDKEKEVMESWEIAEPGRKIKAEKSRKKYFINIKYNNGEVLSKEEEELLFGQSNINNNLNNININIKRNEKIESNSNMLVTNIPPRLNTNNNYNNKSEDKKGSENLINISYSNRDIFYKKLPKIKNYRSLFMKNFYLYSNQSRVVKKMKNNTKGKLPYINQYCKSKEQRENELNDIENNYNIYYSEMKKNNEKEEEIKGTYSSIIQEMNEKLMEVRIRMSTLENERTGINLKKVIEKNNLMIKKLNEILNYNEEIKNNKEVTDDVLFDCYKNYKIYQEEELNLKCKNILKESKTLLEEKFLKEIERVSNKDSKVKPEIIKKYKDIINEGVLELQLNEEIKAFFESIK